jgi:hypothetical protein
MRRTSIGFLAMVVPFLAVAQGCGQPAPTPGDKEVQKTRLLSLYKAYQAYEVSKGKPAATIDDLALEPAVVEELKQRFNLDELGLSLTEAKKDELPKMMMAYEKLAPKDGGLVLFYDGSVKTLTAKEIDKPPAQESRPAQFRGRWSTSREMREGEKVRHSQLVLEFRGDELTFYTEEGGTKGNQFTLKLIGVEQGKDVPYLVLGHSESKYVVYYDFQSERMILVGRLLNRPFEGFSLSGEYKRVEESK